MHCAANACSIVIFTAYILYLSHSVCPAPILIYSQQVHDMSPYRTLVILLLSHSTSGHLLLNMPIVDRDQRIGGDIYKGSNSITYEELQFAVVSAQAIEDGGGVLCAESISGGELHSDVAVKFWLASLCPGQWRVLTRAHESYNMAAV